MMCGHSRRAAAHRWTGHPGVRSGEELTAGERAADRLRNGMGSWTFVFAAIAFLGAGMALNRSAGFDPFPFILLNLVLSCLAALQGAILLIAAKRSDQIASELARHDYEADTHTRTSSSTCRRRSPRCAPSSRSCWLYSITAKTARSARDASHGRQPTDDRRLHEQHRL